MNSEKMAERALKLLHKSLPALQKGHHILWVPPAEHILRCFAFETRFDMKGMAYFWRAAMPLYRPPTFLVLNYADRLLAGERVSLHEPDLDRTIDRLAQVILQSELDYLKGIQGPQDFLRQVDWDSRPSSPNYRLDLALTQYMTGDVPACLETLEQIVAAKLSPRWADGARLARELIEELKINPSALDQRIGAWEERNVAWFQLTPRNRRKAK